MKSKKLKNNVSFRAELSDDTYFIAIGFRSELIINAGRDVCVDVVFVF